jgi:Outer membrane protein beta-barrel domain
MNRVVAIMSVAAILAAVPAFAQEAAPGPGTVEVTLIPGGATFFTSKDAGPEFRNYTYGGAVALNFNRYVGLEGEAGGTVGTAQDLTFRGSTASLKTPNTLTYNGNVVLNVATGHSVVPFVTGGVGGLTMFERTELSINDTQTLLTGNGGGGVKWYAPNGRWGLRADYRFIAVRSKDDAPDFFGRDTRYGHRVYGGVVINAVR